jgi:hypothetical protein
MLVWTAVSAWLAFDTAPGAALSAGPGSAPVSAAVADPVAKVLGIHLGMPEGQAHRLLARIGKRTRLESEAEEEADGLESELWKLRDARFAWLRLSVDADHRVRALQAYTRPGGPGLRYVDIGDLTRARRLGFTIWEWEVASRAGVPGRRVTARGADSTFAGSISITPAGRGR